MIRLILFLFIILNFSGLVAQIDTIHYLPPLHSRENVSIKEHYVYLSTPETVAFEVDVKDGSGAHISGSPFTISNTSPAEVYVGNGQTSGSKLMVEQSELNTVLTDRGLKFYGEKPFYVNARYRDRDRQAGSLTSKGIKSLGTTFRIGYAPMLVDNAPRRNFVIGIMATEDNTNITISDYDQNCVFSGSVDVTDDQLNITLNAGNTMVISGYMDVDANLNGMIGALVESDKPIAISNGNWLGTVSTSKFSQDICIDQIVPVDNLGYIHIPVMAEGEAEDERPMVVAHYDNTQVFLNGSSTPDTTLSAGGYFLINNSFYSGTTHKNMLIQTSQPSYVYQFMAGAQDDKTSGMNFLPPLTCNLPNFVDLIPSIEKIGTQTYDGGLYIISQVGGAVTVNGVTQTDPMPVAGSTDWETYKTLGKTGDVKVVSDKSVAVGFFGVSSAAGYGGYFSGFSSTFKAKFTMPDSVCLGETFDIQFTGDSIANLNVNWDFGSTDVTSTIQNNYFPTSVDYLNDGTYTVALAMDYDGCESSYSKSIVITPLPTATISGTTEVCVDDTNPDITFTGANGTAPYTFTYNINGGANTTVVSTGNTATINVSTANDGTFAYNLVSVSDANTCSQIQTDTATVTINPLPTATISGTTSICEGAINPDITFTGANGTAPYTFTYNINGGANTTVVSTGNTATVSVSTATDGTFAYNLVSVSDASTTACSQTQTGTATVTVNPSPTATISGTTELCVDDTHPDITFTGGDGTAPYTFTYNINGGANTTLASTGNSATISVSTATDGTFAYNLVSVSDASAAACSQTQADTATITINPLPTATISGTTDVTFTGANGTAPYTFTYNINGGANTTVVSTGNTATVNVSNATPGDFTYNLVSVSDASTTNCSQLQIGSVTISINSSPTATISGTTELCVDDTNPDITFTGADGTAPYTFTYNINGGVNTTVVSTGNTVTVSVNTATDGTFAYNLVSVEDNNGSSQAQTGTATVTINPLPTATITGTTELCIGDTSPDITFTGANGTAPYTFTYNINGGANTTVVSTGNTATVSVSTVTDGTFAYNLVSVSDASATACSQIQTGTATVTINPSLTATIFGTTAICVGATNPDITFTGANGTAPYTFTYNINGGANTTVVSTGNTATVSVSTATDGTFAYNLVSVSDASATACSQTQTGTATVTINPSPTATISGTTSICMGATNPDIIFTGANGTAPYTFTYNINGGANTTVVSTGNTATVSASTTVDGTFTYNLISVSDASANNCTQLQTGTATVTVNPSPTATISGTTAICVGATSPDITFTGANGTAPYTFTYNINGGANTTIVSTGNTATLSASTTVGGVFTYNLVGVSDAIANSCFPITGNATVTVNSSPIASISGTTTICEGATNPDITFTGANGTAPYTFTYNINGGANTTITSTGVTDVATVSASALTDGTFTYNLISVSDASANNCSQTQTGAAIITIDSSPTASISGTTSVCEGATNPDITFTGANGTAPYTFTYNINGGTNTTITSTGNTATVSASTASDGVFSYNLVAVSDASANACSQLQSGTSTVTIDPLPTATVSGTTTICVGSTSPDITFTGANGTAPYTFTYNINGGANTTTTSTGNTALISVNTATSGTFTYNLVSVSDATSGSCSQLQPSASIVTIDPLPTATISGTTTVCEGATNPDITFTGANGTAPYTFTYNINGGTNTTVVSTGNTATISVSTTTDGTLSYNLVSVSDASTNNCSQIQTGSATITINPLPTATISGTTTICEGATSPDITFTGANGTAPYTFTYNINGGANTTVTSAGVSDVATVSVSTSVDGTFTYNLVSVTDASANACSQLQGSSAIVTIDPAPTAAISGGTSTCMGATSPDITFTGANGTAPYTFTYNINGGANTTVLSTGNTATISANTSTNGTYNYNLVSVADASTNTCSQLQSSTAILIVTYSPTATISGTTSICKDATNPDITFVGANGIAPYTFTYNINGGANTTVVSTGNTAVVSANTSTEGVFSYNLVAVSDATTTACSPISGTASVTVNPMLTATISGTTSICMGATSPDITFTGANGTAPYTFTYNINGGASTTVTSAGVTDVATISANTDTDGTFTYNLVGIEDAEGNSCSLPLTDNATVTVTTSPTATIVGTTSVCEGATSPEITFTGSNGTAPYTFTYNINGGANTTVTSPGVTDVITVSVSSATDGIFTYNLVAVDDAASNSCSPLSDNATVTINPSPTATISGTTTICEGATSPDITFTGANGTTPYTFTYNINGGANVTVTSLGVTDVATVNTSTANDGTFTYNLVSVSDASNCEQLQTGTAIVTIDPLPTATISGTATACEGDASPDITFTGANGTAPYTFTYNINGGTNTTVVSTGNTATVNASTANDGSFTYNLISVSDASANNCEQLQTGSAIVTIDPLPTATISGTTTICEGATSPDITFTGANGTAPYTFTYNINGGANTTVFSTGNTAVVSASTATAGTFVYNLVSVSDANTNACSQTQTGSATVTVSPLPTATISGTATVCKGTTNPDITFTGANGTAPYTFTYNINGGVNTTVVSNGNTATVSANTTTEGTFVYNLVSVSDASTNVCSQTQTGTATVTVSPLPTATISGNTTICVGATNPNITFTGGNGTAPYTFTYNINGGTNTTVVSTGNTATVSVNSANAGTFIYNLISVSDASANTCSQTQTGTATVIVHPTPTASISGTTTICMGATNPDITFTGANGTSPYTFTYNINGGANMTVTSSGISSTATVSASTAIDGTFTYNLVNVVDASSSNCSQVLNSSAILIVTPSPTATISGATTICVGATNPDITFTGANGTAPYTFTYNINGGANTTITSAGVTDVATISVSTATNGSFTYNLVAVSDANSNSCSPLSGSATVIIDPSPTATISGTTIICKGATSPDITFTGANGTAPYTFTYNINGGANTTVVSTGNTATVNVSTATDGTFTYNLVSVADASNTSCSQIQSGNAIVTVTPSPIATILGTTSVCVGATNPDITFTGSNGTAPYTFTYNINGGVNTTTTSTGNTATVTTSTATAGTYTYNLIAVADATSNSCSPLSGNATITINSSPTASISGTTTICEGATSPDITFTGANGTAPYTFTYNINGGANTTTTSTGNTAVLSVNTTTSGTFTYNLVSVADASNGNCEQLQAGIAIVTIDPLPTATISGTTTICEGATSPDITFTGANGTAPYTFTYNINGGANTTVVSTGNTAVVSASTATADTFVYNLVSVADASANNCEQLQTGSATITIDPLPTATISGTTTICEGATSPDITFTGANGTAPYTFTYNINGGANTTVVSTGNTAVVSASTATAGTFTYNLVSVSDASTYTCSQLQTGTATITIDPLPTATISGTATVCKGTTNPDITFTGANGTAPYTFTYNINGGANTTVVSTGNTATVSASSATDGTFTYNLVSVSDASTYTCSQLQTGTATITIDPLPSATVSGTTTICEGAANPDITFTCANGTAPYTFTYNINGGANTTVVSTGNTATVSANSATDGTFIYNLVSVSDASTIACSQLQTGSATITIDPLPTATISGTTTICKGATSPDITFTGANGTAPYTFTYNINGGANTTITSTGITNVATVSASTVADGIFTYNLVSVSDASSNACSQLQSSSAAVTVTPSPTASITGTTTTCLGATSPDITFTGADGIAPYTFTYNINGGANTTATSIGNTAVISASTVSEGEFNYNLIAIADAAANSCAPLSDIATITISPILDATISGTTTICMGATSPEITFTGANGTAPYTFTYNINGGANTTVVSNGNTATVNASTVIDGIFTYNLISVTDAVSNTCSSTLNGNATVTVTQSPTATITSDNTVCVGSTNSEITFTGANGTAPYTFTYNINGGVNTTVTSPGVTNIATVDVSTVAEGTFNFNLIAVEDDASNSCSPLSGIATITINPLPTATISGTTTICEGATSPEITFTGANGTAPYIFTYNINGGANTTVVSTGNTASVNASTVTNGVFTYNLVSVADASLTNCSQIQTGSATITVNPLPIATISGTTTICKGLTNPEITFTGANGTAPYTFTYNINGGANTIVVSTGNTATVSASAASAGVFTYNLVSVSDASANACSQLQTGSATITVDPLPTATISGTTTICEGATSPDITFTGANGTAPYTFTYNINGGANTTTTSIGNTAVISVNTTTHGTYTYNLVSVSDASTNNCSQIQNSNATVTINSLPTATISGTTTICKGSTSPDITFTGANGKAPYTFTYNVNGGANTTVISTGNTATVSAISTTAGTFTYNLVSVSDASANACSQLQTGSATITVDPLPTAILSGTTTICKGATNPDITFTGSNGTAPYRFTYNINGGSNTTVVSNGNTATVSASTDSDGTFTYNLVSVSDASINSCSQVNKSNVTVTVDPLPTATISGSTTICAGATNPDITFTGANGTAPYIFTYNINGGANTTITSTGNTAVLNTSSATDGVFNYNLVSVSDASINNCSQVQTGTATVTVNPLPTATVSGSTTICQGTTNPDITFTGANGTAPYTFTYNINGGASTTVTSAGFTNIATVSVSTTTYGSFTYNLESVQDASINSCSQTQTGNATITINPLPTATISGTTEICVGETNPDITFTGGNGTAPYTFTYNINGGANTTVVSTGNSATVNISTATNGDFTYNLISVQDASNTNCTQAQTGSATVTINPLPTATISGTTEICQEDGNPDIIFTGANGTAPYTFTYNINGGANTTVVSTGNTATVSVSTTNAGDFTYNLISVQDASNTNCSQAQTGSATVTINPLPTATVSGTTEVCVRDPNPEITFTGANGTAPYTFIYNINGGANTTVVSTGNTATVSVSTTNAGDFTYNLISVQDASNTACLQAQTDSATIIVNPSPVADFSVDENVKSILASKFAFTNQSTGETSINWIYNDEVLGNDDHFYLYLNDTGFFDIMLWIDNDYGCKDSTSTTVRVIPEFSIYFPNSFTPNDDGMNDYWFPVVAYGLKDYKCYVFNRWGELIFETENYKEQWDGSINHSDKMAQEGIYTYKAIVHDTFGKEHIITGHVSIVR